MLKSFVLALGLLMAIPVSACDICGCSAQGATLGLLPGVSSHFIGVRYHYRRFTSEHPPVFTQGTEEWSQDHFSTAELWGRISILPRLELFAFVPYNQYTLEQHSSEAPVRRTSNSGLGDVSVLLNAVILRTPNAALNSKPSHNWLIGAGVKAPTGSFGQVDEERGLVLPNMQMGTGSWDFSVVSNYRLQWKDWGLNVNASYRYNTPNNLRYQFGQSVLGTLDILRVFALKESEIQLIPQAGVRFELYDQDYSNQSRREINTYSGGHFLYASAGMDGYWGKFGFNLRADIPMDQEFASGYVKNQWRMTAGILYLFQQKKQ